MNMTAEKKNDRDECYYAVAFNLFVAQQATCSYNYPAAAFALVAALDPVNFFDNAISEREKAFIKKFVHDCIDEVSKLLTSDMNAIEAQVGAAIKSHSSKALSSERRAVSKHLN